MQKTRQGRFGLTAAMICLCFLLGSTQWLAWEYHLLAMVSHAVTDLVTMVAGYLLQAAGLGLFALLLRRRPEKAGPAAQLSLGLQFVCLLPAVLTESFSAALVFGLAMNLFCGMSQGYYLCELSRSVEAGRRGMALGLGYGVSILASWLLSKLGGTLYYSGRVWVICLLLTAATAGLICLGGRQPRPEPDTPEEGRAFPPVLSLCALVLLFSLVNSSGFAFPSADLLQGVRVESSRLFYAFGLVLAGWLSDRDRKYGAVLALSALAIPFMLLALRGEPISSTVFWTLNYVTFGFYSVYRMIVFADLAQRSGKLHLSGFGLMLGRAGDAAGDALCRALDGRLTVQIGVTAALFAASIFLFFHVYRLLYEPAPAAPPVDERAFFQEYAARHDLSAREGEVLRLLLEEKSSVEIAEVLCVSDSTVKYHIHNLLKKTGCRNRLELTRSYAAQLRGKPGT